MLGLADFKTPKTPGLQNRVESLTLVSVVYEGNRISQKGNSQRANFRPKPKILPPLLSPEGLWPVGAAAPAPCGLPLPGSSGLAAAARSAATSRSAPRGNSYLRYRQNHKNEKSLDLQSP